MTDNYIIAVNGDEYLTYFNGLTKRLFTTRNKKDAARYLFGESEDNLRRLRRLFPDKTFSIERF